MNLLKKKVFYHTKYNEYWDENVKLFEANDFIVKLPQHILSQIQAFNSLLRTLFFEDKSKSGADRKT